MPCLLLCLLGRPHLSNPCRAICRNRRPPARQDLYAKHGQDVAAHFLDSLFADIDSLTVYAGVHVQVWGFYRMLAQRFPYAIYYKVDGDLCVVSRVLDCRRDPRRLREALARR